MRVKSKCKTRIRKKVLSLHSLHGLHSLQSAVCSLQSAFWGDQSYGNMSVSLGEQEMLWDRNTENMFSISFRKYSNEKGNQLINFYHQNVNSIAHAITSTAQSSSVSTEL